MGAIASHGIVVIAPEHRDSSCPVAYIRSPDSEPSTSLKYRKMPHVGTEEVFTARDGQLSIRLWEVSLIYEALEKINKGRSSELRNLDPNSPSAKAEPFEALSMFSGKLDMSPEKVIWAGHSFGGATIVQLVKSIYWHARDDSYKRDESYKPLFVASEQDQLIAQIGPSSPVVLLDLWTLPLRSLATRWLWDKPLPTYLVSDPNQSGRAALSIMSTTFFNYRDIAKNTRRVLSHRPADEDPSLGGSPGPFAYYVSKAAHLSQSDFGILFSLVSTNFIKTQSPERILKLNTRAICEFLRLNGVAVSPPTKDDFSIGSNGAKSDVVPAETILNETGRVDVDDFVPIKIEGAPTSLKSEESVKEPSVSVSSSSPKI